MTPVYSEFRKRIQEVEILRVRAARLEKSSNRLAHKDEISALCRGGVVLLSSHIEAYVKELGEHTLDKLYSKRVPVNSLSPRFFYHVSKRSIEEIRKTEDHDRLAGKVFDFISTQSPFWITTGSMPRPVQSSDFNAGFSNPTFDKVCTYINRFGFSDFRGKFRSKLGRDSNAVITGLDNIVSTRNSIAHGESDATKTPSDVKEMIETARKFCLTSDSIFSDWCRTNLCTIR